MQSILHDFVNIELLYHAKALEMYTQCYQSLNHMDEEQDLEVSHSLLVILYTLAAAIKLINAQLISLDRTQNVYNINIISCVDIRI